MKPTLLTDEDVDRRAHVSWSEAVGRIERIVMDTVEELESKEGGAGTTSTSRLEQATGCIAELVATWIRASAFVEQQGGGESESRRRRHQEKIESS